MAILVRERELREEVARLTRENARLVSLVNTAAQPIRNALERFDALVTDEEAQSPGNRLSAAVKRDRAAVEGLRTLLGRVERRASDNPAPDVQAALAKALLKMWENFDSHIHGGKSVHPQLATANEARAALRAAGWLP